MIQKLNKNIFVIISTITLLYSCNTEVKTNGTINAEYSIGPNKQIYFSQGNLFYNPHDNEWWFADEQFRCVGKSGGMISPSYNGYIDLFGWGTSGWDNGNTYFYPFSKNADLVSVGNGYGPYDGNSCEFDLTGPYKNGDWGVYNIIENGSDYEWRTLSDEEWKYIMFKRDNAEKLHTQCRIDSVNGVMLLPDDWDFSIDFDATNSGWFSNVFSLEEWREFEQKGAVFLPAAGHRHSSLVKGVNSYGYYWSVTHNNIQAYNLYFDEFYINSNSDYRKDGMSVRLVREVKSKKKLEDIESI